jgi:hypothetical protein
MSPLFEAGMAQAEALRTAPSQLGMTPATYQRGGKGAQIDFGVVSVRWVSLVAATEKASALSLWAIRRKRLRRSCATSFLPHRCNTMKRKLEEWTQAILN